MNRVLRVLFVALTENETVRGVERYALELARALATRYSREVEVTLLCGAWQRYFHELERIGVRLLVAPVKNSRPSRHFFLLLRMRRLSGAFDLVHYGNLMPIAISNKVASTMTVHDVAEYAMPRKYSLRQRAYRRLVGWCAVRRVARLVADSEFSRGEIHRYLGVPLDCITVIYPGVDHFRTLPKPRPLPAPEPYFLYYGVIEETKGADTAVLAFRRLLTDRSARDARLVLIGRPGNAYERLKPLIDGDRIIHLGYLDDPVLQQYIVGALAVVFVSRYEGFGLPALEAYMLNDTVIASAGNSVGEVSRDFAYAVDENSIDAVADAMRSVLAGRQPKPRLSRDAVHARYSWARAAEQILTLFLTSAGQAVAPRSGH